MEIQACGNGARSKGKGEEGHASELFRIMIVSKWEKPDDLPLPEESLGRSSAGSYLTPHSTMTPCFQLIFLFPLTIITILHKLKQSCNSL